MQTSITIPSSITVAGSVGTICTGTVAASSNFIDYLLAELKCAGLRTRLLTAEIDSIGVALTGNLITPDDAIEWAHEIGALNLVSTS